MPNKKIIIFTGLSISFEDAQKILDADYRPPVQRGDIIKALKDKPDIIGIIDGVFHQHPAVSHKEIMQALNENVVVVGGSSMGALRASELDGLGMIGLGFVYKQYREGIITSDDDVAVTFDPETKTTLSEALVNVEYKLNLAVKNGIISDDVKNHILKVAKSIYYPKRTYYYIFSKSNLDDDVKNNLADFIATVPDIKNLDAIEVLEYIKKLEN
ncbi:MAG: TfuA-related McrA-glycine thioamidation protein [Methanobacteriaceae archaeon]|nr:TfuA-related McrA-glycine thioamidation protein [Methanobacteriaceae archaeon]